MRHLAQLLMVLSIVLQGMMPAMAMQAPMPHHQSAQSHHHGYGADKVELAGDAAADHCPTCKPMHAMTCCSASLCGTCLSPMPVVTQGRTKILPLRYPLARVAQMLAGAPDPLVPPPRA